MVTDPSLRYQVIIGYTFLTKGVQEQIAKAIDVYGTSTRILLHVLTALLSPLRLSHDEILATLNTVLHQVSIVCAMRVYLIHHCVDHGKHGMAKTALCDLAGKHSQQLPKRNP